MSLISWLEILEQNLNRTGSTARRRSNVRKAVMVEVLTPRVLLSAVNPLPLSSLNGSNGFRLDGIDTYDASGRSVSSAGDVNGDGFDDVIIGAYFGDAGATDSGESYVVFGKSGGFASALDLSSLDGSTGFRLDGIDADDRSGFSVSRAGDVNGDGFNDLIIGAYRGDAGTTTLHAGESYVVFGKSGGFASALGLSSLNGSNGFRLDGIDAGDVSGASVSSAGDVNGDGFDDLIIGAYLADAGANASGESYVVFGKSGGFASAIDLSSLNGNTGFRLDGIDASDFSGFSVSSAGDVNGDGFDDLIIGAYLGEAGDLDSGESYVVFGKSGGFASAMDLSSLDGSNGFRLDGINYDDRSGRSVSSAGDVNGDGFDDLIVGAHFGDAGATDSGESYVVFGRAGGFASAIDLSSLNGSTGFRLDGIDENDRSGRSVSSAGDVNGDGFDDLIIGAYFGDAGANNSGESYVVFGKSGGFASALDLSSLDGSTGFQLDGIDASDFSGFSVNYAGDVNGDGFDDLIIGARDGDAGASNSGESYVVFGGNFTGGAETQVGNASPNMLMAVNGAGLDVLIGGGGNDTLVSDGGPDVLIGGQGNDILAIPNADFSSTRRVVGGTGINTLRLDGSGITLNLTTIHDNRIVDINEINITGSGANTLTLNAREVLNISSHSNTLIVRRDMNDTVNIGTGWTKQSDESISGNLFAVYTQGAATLKVQYPARLGLAMLNGNNGFRLDGIDAGDRSGLSVSGAGDVNGDGFDDLIIGAYAADAGANDSGESYVVFGKSGGFTSALDLSSLDGSNGFRIDGIDANDQSGRSVSSAGDVNGDGFDDLIVGAYGADAGATDNGESYVVFGKSGGFTSALDLSSLNGSNGFRLNGVDASSRSGYSVSSAGDVNGDGFDDLIVGAYEGDAGAYNSGESYVVFGKSGGFASALDLSSLNGSNGFRLDGVDAYDYSGFSVSGAGDVNGDGFADLIIGAYRADAGAIDSGESYVVFGKSGGFASALHLSALNGSNGFRLDGTDVRDFSGLSVSAAGDVNGDGFDDLIIGAPGADGVDLDSGESYVVFGKSGGFASALDLSTLNGSNGFRLDGIDTNDNAGRPVSGAGDVNGDGFDDLIIGASLVHAGPNYSGESYVVFGKSGGFASALDLLSLNGSNGFKLDGIDAYDYSGRLVSSAGDVNGDGFDDLIIGAQGGDAGGNFSGESYVVFGGNFTGGAETQVGNALPNTLTAVNGAGRDVLIGGGGNDTLVSDGGPDVLIGGEGDDILAISDIDFSSTRRLMGGTGTNTLRLDGSGLTLNLTAIHDNRIQDIEVIDITGSGANTLTLNVQEVLNISSHSNTLIVRRNGDDTVNIGSGWTQGTNEVIEGKAFHVFSQGVATLKVQISISLSTPSVTVPASSTSQRPTISWAAVAGATGYEVWIDDLSTITSPFHLATTAGTSYVPTVDLGIGRFQVWVRANGGTGIVSTWSQSRFFTILTPVTANNPTLQQTGFRPTLTWNALPGADHYDVWIDNTSNGVSQIVRNTNVASTSLTVASDLPVGTYHVWVRGIAKGNLTAAWSTFVSFRIAVAPTITQGQNAAFARTPVIKWNALPGAHHYDIWINNLSTGAIQVVRNTNVTSTTFTGPNTLPIGNYRIWVRGIATDGYPTVWSAATNFSINGAPTVTQGQNSTFDNTPTFAWNALPGATKYEVFIQNLTTGATTLNPKNITATQFTPTASLNDGPYRWWVRAETAQGFQSLWSAPMDVNIGGRTKLLTPSGTTSDRTPTFTWQKVDGVARYDLWVDKIGGPSQIIRQQSLSATATTYTPITALAAGTYRAWVRAVSTSGQISLWSIPVDFTIATNSGRLDSSDFLPDTLASAEFRLPEFDPRQTVAVSQDEQRNHSDESAADSLITVATDETDVSSGGLMLPQSIIRIDETIVDAVMADRDSMRFLHEI